MSAEPPEMLVLDFRRLFIALIPEKPGSQKQNSEDIVRYE